MTLEQLTYFISIYNYGSISKAAEMLFVSQSTVSTAISRFEKEIGYTLFSRSKTGTIPTHHAHMLINYAETILQQVKAIEHYSFDQNNTPSYNLHICSVPAFSQFFLPEVIAKYINLVPTFHIELQEARLRETIFSLLQDNKIDIGIINNTEIYAQKIVETFQKKDIKLKFLYKCSMSYYVRAEHPLLLVNHLSPEIISQYVLISNSNLLRFSQNKIPFTHIIEEENIRYIKQMLCVNDFIAILPDFYPEKDLYIQNHQIERLPYLSENIPMSFDFCALYNVNNDIAKSFIDFLLQELKQLP